MKIRTIAVGPLQANCYIVIDEATKAAAIIDPGDDINMVIETVRDSGANVKEILLTHGHFDHAFAVGELQKTFDVDMRIHEADVVQLEGSLDVGVMFYDVSSYQKPKIGPFLTDGETISLGETELNVIHTPGHSEGSVCFLSGDVVFTGDTLFAGGIGRSDFPGGSSETLMNSISEKLLTLPDETVIYPGHGSQSTIGDERETNPWIQGLS